MGASDVFGLNIMNKREFILPNGKITINVRRYINAYRRLARPICGLFPEESRHGYSFDPGLLLGQFSLTNSPSKFMN